MGHLKRNHTVYNSHLPTGAFMMSCGGGGSGEAPPPSFPLHPLVQVGHAVAARRGGTGRQRGGWQVVAKAEWGGDQVEAVQTGRLTPSSPRLLLEELVEVGSQAAAHPAPKLASAQPGNRRALSQLRWRGGAIAWLCLLAVIAKITCGVKYRALNT